MHIPFQVFDNTLTSMHAALQFLVINGAGEVDKKKERYKHFYFKRGEERGIELDTFLEPS